MHIPKSLMKINKSNPKRWFLTFDNDFSVSFISVECRIKEPGSNSHHVCFAALHTITHGDVMNPYSSRYWLNHMTESALVLWVLIKNSECKPT